MSLPVREGVHLFLHKDTVEYLSYLAKKWNLKSKSDVIEEITRRTWKAEHKARLRKLEKNSAAA